MKYLSLIFIASAISVSNHSCVLFFILISFIGATLSIVSEILFNLMCMKSSSVKCACVFISFSVTFVLTLCSVVDLIVAVAFEDVGQSEGVFDDACFECAVVSFL